MNVDHSADVIIVGSGMGGGTLCRQLTEAGLKVLLVEKGPTGRPGEQQRLSRHVQGRVARLARGTWPEKMHATIDGKPREHYGPVGAGLGGTTSFYAAALERLERHDIDDSADRPHPTGGWPIRYDDMAPFYEAAEKQYEVRGEPVPHGNDKYDHLGAPPPLSPADEDLVTRLKASGLNPYRLHVGIRYKPGCTECVGRKCARQCKLDSVLAGIDPARRTGNLEILDACDVRHLHYDGDKISHIDAVRGDQSITLSAPVIVLAAGGFATPRLLLTSAQETAPNGIANASGVVGQNLMFHVHEKIALWPKRGSDFTGPIKTLALRDFYFVDGERYGLFHAMGLDATFGAILGALQEQFDYSPFAQSKLLRAFLRIPASIASVLFGDARIYSAIIEDMPLAQNRIIVDPVNPDVIRFNYSYPDELITRRKKLRTEIMKRLGSVRAIYLNTATEANVGHPCGTVRFGNDPATSALDKNCRAHEVSNLYVVDSSFMPSSGGVNPSLTIAANALRVGDHILKTWQQR